MLQYTLQIVMLIYSHKQKSFSPDLQTVYKNSCLECNATVIVSHKKKRVKCRNLEQKNDKIALGIYVLYQEMIFLFLITI